MKAFGTNVSRVKGTSCHTRNSFLIFADDVLYGRHLCQRSKDDQGNFSGKRPVTIFLQTYVTHFVCVLPIVSLFFCVHMC